jgi:hypothetical protein
VLHHQPSRVSKYSANNYSGSNYSTRKMRRPRYSHRQLPSKRRP